MTPHHLHRVLVGATACSIFTASISAQPLRTPARPHGPDAPITYTPVPEPTSANTPPFDIPPAPDGITDLRLNEIFKRPFGDYGLEYSDKAKSLAGKRVRILGYMVNRCSHIPGQFMLASFPITLHDHEMGPCDDLPAETVFVTMPALRYQIVPHTPGLFLLTGTLALGPREEPDGRISNIRLELEMPSRRPRTESAATQPTPPAAIQTTIPTVADDAAPLCDTPVTNPPAPEPHPTSTSSAPASGAPVPSESIGGSR